MVVLRSFVILLGSHTQPNQLHPQISGKWNVFQSYLIYKFHFLIYIERKEKKKVRRPFYLLNVISYKKKKKKTIGICFT